MTWCDELKCSNTPSNRKGKNSFKWKTGKNVFGENVWGIFQRIIERVARGTAHNFFYVVLLCARACIKCVLSKVLTSLYSVNIVRFGTQGQISQIEVRHRATTRRSQTADFWGRRNWRKRGAGGRRIHFHHQQQRQLETRTSAFAAVSSRIAFNTLWVTGPRY